MITNDLISPMKVSVIMPVLPFLNNPKDLDLSYKTDLDLWDCLKGEKICLITEEIQRTAEQNQHS